MSYPLLNCKECGADKSRRSFGYRLIQDNNPCVAVKEHYLYHCRSCGANTEVELDINGNVVHEWFSQERPRGKWIDDGYVSQ